MAALPTAVCRMAAPQARPLTPLPPAVVPGSCTRGGAALFAARRHSLLDVLSLRSRDRGAPERQWGRSRWVDLRWPVPQGSMAHVGRIGDPAQRKWRALRASACRRAAYTFSRYTVRAGLGSRDLYQCVCLEEWIMWICGSHAESDGKGPYRLLFGVFLKP